MTAQPDTAEAPVADPNRHRRALICLAPELLHDLLQLPTDVEIRHFGISRDSLTINIVVTSPDLPECDEGAHAPEIQPVYAKVFDRPALIDPGTSRLLGAAHWEWNYRYPDTGPAQFDPITEGDARIAAAKDLSVILLRRRPGTTEWEEAPA